MKKTSVKDLCMEEVLEAYKNDTTEDEKDENLQRKTHF